MEQARTLRRSPGHEHTGRYLKAPPSAALTTGGQDIGSNLVDEQRRLSRFQVRVTHCSRPTDDWVDLPTPVPTLAVAFGRLGRMLTHPAILLVEAQEYFPIGVRRPPEKAINI